MNLICPLCKKHLEDCDCPEKNEWQHDQEGSAIGPCPQCGTLMRTIRGLKTSICKNCGYKDSCCY